MPKSEPEKTAFEVIVKNFINSVRTKIPCNDYRVNWTFRADGQNSCFISFSHEGRMACAAFRNAKCEGVTDGNRGGGWIVGYTPEAVADVLRTGSKA